MSQAWGAVLNEANTALYVSGNTQGVIGDFDGDSESKYSSIEYVRLSRWCVLRCILSDVSNASKERVLVYALSYLVVGSLFQRIGQYS